MTKRKRNQQFSGRGGTSSHDASDRIFVAACKLINQENGLTPPVKQYFTLLAKSNWLACVETLVRIHPQQPAIAAALETATGVGPVIRHGDWIVCLRHHRYVVIHRNTQEVHHISTFGITMERGIWFEQEREMWLEAKIHLNTCTYPLLIKSSDIDRAGGLISACQAAVYANVTDIVTLQLAITSPEHTPALIRLIRHQAQSVACIKGLSKLGWHTQTMFVTPAWLCDATGPHNKASQLYPQHEGANRAYATSPTEPKLPALSFPTKLAPAIGFLLTAIVASLQRLRQGWPCFKINMRHTPDIEQLLRAVFSALGQTSALAVDWKHAEHLLSCYPFFTTQQYKVPETCPAFCLGPSGLVLPDPALLPHDLAHVSAITRHILTLSLQHIILEQPTDNPQILTGPSQLAQEGHKIIAACYGDIPFAPGRGEDLWQYLSDIKLAEVGLHITLDMKSQHVYLNFRKSVARRSKVRDDLILHYPETEAALVGLRYIRINAVEGLELLHQFYGPHMPISRKTMGENLEEDADSEPVSLTPPSV